jgi:hypothetical protein
MSLMRVPEELRQEFGFVVLFRDLAETLDRESEDSLGLPAPPGTGVTPGFVEPDANPEGDVGAEAESSAARRRADLGPKPCSPSDLINQALDRLEADEVGKDLGSVDVSADLTPVLVDSEQVVQALARLLQNAAHRAAGAHHVHLKAVLTKAVGERGVRPEPFIRIDLLFPREEMTEEDLSPDPETERTRQLRRQDIATAEQLLQANGGRLIQQLGEGDQRLLSAFLPISGRA